MRTLLFSGGLVYMTPKPSENGWVIPVGLSLPNKTKVVIKIRSKTNLFKKGDYVSFNGEFLSSRKEKKFFLLEAAGRVSESKKTSSTSLFLFASEISVSEVIEKNGFFYSIADNVFKIISSKSIVPNSNVSLQGEFIEKKGDLYVLAHNISEMENIKHINLPPDSLEEANAKDSFKKEEPLF